MFIRNAGDASFSSTLPAHLVSLFCIYVQFVGLSLISFHTSARSQASGWCGTVGIDAAKACQQR